jgi:hypothetical protein
MVNPNFEMLKQNFDEIFTLGSILSKLGILTSKFGKMVSKLGLEASE